MTNNKRLNGVGFDSRRPLALYERIILASSNEGDIVLDPFCGYATTPIVAERNNRQRVGMDIWNGAHQMVPDRLESEGLAVPNRRGGRRQQESLITFGDIHYESEPPQRTDHGEPATFTLRNPTGRAVQFPPLRSYHGRLLGLRCRLHV